MKRPTSAHCGSFGGSATPTAPHSTLVAAGLVVPVRGTVGTVAPGGRVDDTGLPREDRLQSAELPRLRGEASGCWRGRRPPGRLPISGSRGHGLIG